MDHTGVIRTDRLILRRLRPEDAPALAEGMGHWDVVKWLTSPPWPYTLADSEWFLAEPMSAEVFGIILESALIGVVGMHPDDDSDAVELGYWLSRSFHGQGCMTEATHAVVTDHFAHSDVALVSGYLVGNRASCNVLTKLGFRNTELIMRFARPIGYDVPLQRMELTKADWQARPAA